VTQSRPIGVLVMAYGTATGPEDIERYYTDIRGGRRPTAEHLEELRQRYETIGNVFPLLETTRDQANGLVDRLNSDSVGDTSFRPYVGMKHSAPFIAEAVDRMVADGIERAVGLVMAPHWSGMSVETYIDRVKRAAANRERPSFSYVRAFHDHPAFVSFLARRVAATLDELGPDERSTSGVIFSAHSLPTRVVENGSLRCKQCDCEASCRYRDGLQETADLVAAEVGLVDYSIAWQSAGRTDDPWWGPSVDETIRRLAASGRSAAVVCSAGFVADHLETLFDLDVEAGAVARDAGITFARTRMPNADPEFLDALAEIVRHHLWPTKTQSTEVSA